VLLAAVLLASGGAFSAVRRLPDPLYGARGDGAERGGLSLGRLTPRGEKDVLIVPIDALMRVSWNPFFPYLLDQIDGAVAGR
jgi:hypothetical protein